jgi:hypothetical protein
MRISASSKTSPTPPLQLPGAGARQWTGSLPDRTGIADSAPIYQIAFKSLAAAADGLAWVKEPPLWRSVCVNKQNTSRRRNPKKAAQIGAMSFIKAF